LHGYLVVLCDLATLLDKSEYRMFHGRIMDSQGAIYKYAMLSKMKGGGRFKVGTRWQRDRPGNQFLHTHNSGFLVCINDPTLKLPIGFGKNEVR
jgi:hypothetical protein